MLAGDLTPREEQERWEACALSEQATKSTDCQAIRREWESDYKPDDFRTEFQRDYTRIVHSRAFRRLRHKTQVFISPQNDHLCTRMEHSLHVASVGNTIARALRLNTDLVSAIAVGHDLGHAPFGHKGEKCLDKLARKAGLEGFCHELQSLRIVDYLESPYSEHSGLNLTFAVRDGIVCHYGEGFKEVLAPERTKDPQELACTRRGQDSPATLEGCVVRWADIVAYIGRDLEDAYAVGLLKEQDIPKSVAKMLGRSNRSIIAGLVADIVAESRDKGEIRISDRTLQALRELYEFSRERIYNSPTVTRYFSQVDKAMEILFGELVELIRNAQEKGRDGNDLFPERRETWCLKVLSEFLRKDYRTWWEEKPERLALDFVAGMTDSFFIRAFEELFFPQSTV